MNDLETLTGRSGNSLVRSVRTGTALFGGGVVVGVLIAFVFHALIDTIVVGGALLIVLVFAVRMMIGRKRRY